MNHAKELMTKDLIIIQSGWEIKEAIHIFNDNNIHSAPVITPLGEVLGMMTELSLVKASLRNYLDTGKSEKVVHHADILEEAFFVGEEDTVGEVVKIMFKAPHHRVLVLNKHKKIAGIISPKDIIGFVTGEKSKSIDLKAELDKSKKEAEKLHQEVSGLKNNLEKYRALFQDTPYMMHAADDSGKIMLANKKIHQVLGYEDRELIGKSIFELYPKSVHHEATDGLKKIIQTGFHHTTYTTMVNKKGEKIRVDIASSALRDANGKFVSTISISRKVDSELLLRALHGIVDQHSEEQMDESLRKTGT